MSRREDYDRQIRADQVKRGDELHLTVMGGDEYVTVSFKRDYPEYTLLKWTSWGGAYQDRIPHNTRVWVKK